MFAMGNGKGLADAPWSTYYAAFIPGLLACALFGLGTAVLWSPIPAAVVYGGIALAIGTFLFYLERRRRQLIAEGDEEETDPEALASFRKFSAEQARIRPWMVIWLLVLIVMILVIMPLSAGLILFVAGFGVIAFDSGVIAPWLYRDIETRMAVGLR